MPNRNPKVANLLRFIPQVSTWLTSYTTSQVNPYGEMIQVWRLWVSGTAQAGRYAVQGKVLMTELPGLLHPIGPGWSFANSSYSNPAGGTVITAPIDTPIISVSGSYLTSDPTNYPSVGGSGSLQFVSDSRENRLLRPMWVG